MQSNTATGSSNRMVMFFLTCQLSMLVQTHVVYFLSNFAGPWLSNRLLKYAGRCSCSCLHRWNCFSYTWRCWDGPRFTYKSCSSCCFCFQYSIKFCVYIRDKYWQGIEILQPEAWYYSSFSDLLERILMCFEMKSTLKKHSQTPCEQYGMALVSDFF